MKVYTIVCAGCDDDTKIRMALTDEEAAVVQRVAEAVTAASESVCQPSMSIAADSEQETDR